MAERIEVLKTYKTFVGGKFPRSESDVTYQVKNQSGNHIANACRCTRKDMRDAVVAARGAFKGWSMRSAYNRGQILYRIAEMLEGRKSQFSEELQLTGIRKKHADSDVEKAIDRLIYFAGWTDKYSQVFGTINPVASAHFNFSSPDPTGIVGVIAPEKSPLLGLVSAVAPIIAGGNCAVVIASESNPLSAVSFGEVLNSSDVPGGVVNILTGFLSELTPSMSTHMDINAILNTSSSKELMKQIDENAALNIKRVTHYSPDDWTSDEHEHPYLIMDFQETKTTWHPVGV